MKSVDELLRKVSETGASDLHLKVGSPPVVRVDGELVNLDEPPCSPDDTKDFAAGLMSDKQLRRFSETNEIDFAYSAPMWVGSVWTSTASADHIDRSSPVVTRVPDFAELNLPPVVQKLALEPRGLILVTGTTGSGQDHDIAS